MADSELEPAADWLDPVEALNEFRPPEGYVLGAAEAGDARAQVADTGLTRYGFRTGGVGLLIGAGVDSEVLDALPVSALPNTPAWLLGLINLRGNLVPVFDLVELLGLSRDPGHQRRMLILDEGERAVGVLIDRLPEVPQLTRRLGSLPPLPGQLGEYVSDAYLSSESVWLEFDHRAFFASLSTHLAA